ncbi:hypothetical protein [Paenarthrobacter sp. NPDC090522]|uniref:hypothetical protein n=1 Tax=Paenarthrobacter sp. NPDC090522 TaxID=3364383 RepID=UPI00381D8878
MPESSMSLPDYPTPSRAEKFAERAYPALSIVGPILAATGLLGGWAGITFGWDIQAHTLFLMVIGLGFAAMGAARLLSFRPLAGTAMALFGAAVMAVGLFLLMR